MGPARLLGCHEALGLVATRRTGVEEPGKAAHAAALSPASSPLIKAQHAEAHAANAISSSGAPSLLMTALVVSVWCGAAPGAHSVLLLPHVDSRANALLLDIP